MYLVNWLLFVHVVCFVLSYTANCCSSPSLLVTPQTLSVIMLHLILLTTSSLCIHVTVYQREKPEFVLFVWRVFIVCDGERTSYICVRVWVSYCILLVKDDFCSCNGIHFVFKKHFLISKVINCSWILSILFFSKLCSFKQRVKHSTR